MTILNKDVSYGLVGDLSGGLTRIYLVSLSTNWANAGANGASISSISKYTGLDSTFAYSGNELHHALFNNAGT